MESIHSLRIINTEMKLFIITRCEYALVFFSFFSFALFQFNGRNNVSVNALFLHALHFL